MNLLDPALISRAPSVSYSSIHSCNNQTFMCIRLGHKSVRAYIIGIVVVHFFRSTTSCCIFNSIYSTKLALLIPRSTFHCPVQLTSLIVFQLVHPLLPFRSPCTHSSVSFRFFHQTFTHSLSLCMPASFTSLAMP